MGKSYKAAVTSIGLAISILSSPLAVNAQTPYTVKPGDTFYLISKSHQINMHEMMKINNATEHTIIYPGQVLKIPQGNTKGYSEVNTRGDVGNNTLHAIIKGDTLWKLSRQYLVSSESIQQANRSINFSNLQIGKTINIPQKHDIPITKTDGKHGINIDWNIVNKLIPIGATFKVTDFNTGSTYNIKRTVGYNHADVEPLTKADTEIMKKLWGGYSWSTRPSIVEYEGHRIASSVSFMPHAGNDSAPAYEHTNWRSGGYGPGENYDYIKGNGIDGHIDIYFEGSIRHKDGKPDLNHNNAIKIASGIK